MFSEAEIRFWLAAAPSTTGPEPRAVHARQQSLSQEVQHGVARPLLDRAVSLRTLRDRSQRSCPADSSQVRQVRDDPRQTCKLFLVSPDMTLLFVAQADVDELRAELAETKTALRQLQLTRAKEKLLLERMAVLHAAQPLHFTAAPIRHLPWQVTTCPCTLHSS